MILKEYVLTSWNVANKKHLIHKGYEFTKLGEKINVLMEDLSPTSPIKIKASCNECGKIFEREMRSLRDDCLCIKCNSKKWRDKKRKRCRCGNAISRPKDHDLCPNCRVTQYTKNDYAFIDNDTVVIFMRDSKNKVNGYTFIDSKNLQRVIQYKWRIGTGNYILGGENNLTRLHRFIMSCPNDMEIDHMNHITIDNREENLMITTRKDNCNNRRDYRKFRYADIKLNDTSNGDGVRISFWLQGCDLRCKNCHNESIWDFDSGKQYNQSVPEIVIKNINANGINRKISILGGEPLHERNIDVTLDFLINIKRNIPDVEIWLWTGYLFEHLNSDKQVMVLSFIDVLIDGKFDIEKKRLDLKYKGSSNQRVIKVQESLKEGKVILLDV